MARRGNERSGHLFLGGKSEAAHAELTLSVPCGETHTGCMFTFDLCTRVLVRVGEREGGRRWV